MLCRWCFAAEGLQIKRQPDRPCPRCTYTGDWNDDPVFVTAPHYSLTVEAMVEAQRSVEALLAMQDNYQRPGK